MIAIVMWILLGIGGFAVTFVGGFYFGGPYGGMVGMGGGALLLLPLLQMISTGKQKKFLPLYVNLKEHEKYLMFPDRFGKLRVMIVNTRHEGVCYKKGLGFIDDKGTEFSWGSDPCSIGEPKLGMTVDIKNASFTELLEKNRDIRDYDEALETYLGKAKYTAFCEKYRSKDKPDIYDINKELDSLMNEKHPENALKEKVFGETWGFRNFLRFLKYAYHPLAMDIAVDSEKLWVKQEMMGYKDAEKAMGWAKAIVWILFGLMIFIAVLSSLNMEGLGSMFGM